MDSPDTPHESAVLAAATLAVEIGKKLGPDHVEVVARDDAELSVTVLNQIVLSVQLSRTRALGIRTIAGGKSGIAWSTNWSPDGIRRVAQASFDAAKYAQRDDMGAPAKPGDTSTTCAELDLWDESTALADPKELASRLLRMERATLARHSAVSSSDGYSWISSASARGMAFSSDFTGSLRKTTNTVVLRPLIMDQGGAVRNGATWTAAIHKSDIPAEDVLADRSVKYALDQVGAKPIPSGSYPVVFRPEAGRRLLTQLANTLSGPAIARGKSPYSRSVGTVIASTAVSIDDHPLLARGLGSRTYDGEGLPTARTSLISAGKLENILCDLRAARILERRPTASAKRAVSSLPQASVSNFRLLPGSATADELEDMEHGVIITELLGFGFNSSTGDFSYGAVGFFVANGRIRHAIQGITVGGTFSDFWQRVELVGSDLDQRSYVQCPSFRVAVVSISGT